MMALRENKTAMKFATYITNAPIFNTDEDGNILYFTDTEGNRYPMDTGETEDKYGNVTDMSANISMSGGDAEPVEYGLSVSDYQAVLVTDRNAYTLKEGDYIWVNSPVEYEYNGEEVELPIKGGDKVTTKVVKVETADYQVMKKSDSLNFTKFILKAVNK